MRYRPHATPLLLVALLAGCGGGSPSGPSTPVATHSAVLTAYYDVNNNGVLDPGENNRVPGVSLQIAGQAATAEPVNGQARVSGVPSGTHAVSWNAATLPAYYQPSGASIPPVTVPQPAGSEHAVPFVLPIGGNRPYTYMAFGDSVTDGDGSSDGAGYINHLQRRLANHFGTARMIQEGITGTRSNDGAHRLGPLLDRHLPAYTLILYGTNDYNDRYCRDEPPCYTVDALRSMVREVRSTGSLPVLSTILPANELFTDRVPPERNLWVRDVNDRIRAMAREERVAVADAHRIFTTTTGPLFSDHVHPNDRGYELLAQAFFEAITRPVGATTTSSHHPFGRSPFFFLP
jgi:lysophospholipase L1-like esterase